jgi:diacylglycerol kinase family enzyme
MARLILNPAAGTDEGSALLARINERLREHLGDLDITSPPDPATPSAPASARRVTARRGLSSRAATARSTMY